MTRKEILDSLDDLIAGRKTGIQDFEELVFQVGLGINTPSSHAEWALVAGFSLCFLDAYGGVKVNNQWLGRPLHRHESKEIISEWADANKNNSLRYELILQKLKDAKEDRTRALLASQLGGCALLNLEKPEIAKVSFSSDEAPKPIKIQSNQTNTDVRTTKTI